MRSVAINSLLDVTGDKEFNSLKAGNIILKIAPSLTGNQSRFLKTGVMWVYTCGSSCRTLNTLKLLKQLPLQDAKQKTSNQSSNHDVASIHQNFGRLPREKHLYFHSFRRLPNAGLQTALTGYFINSKTSNATPVFVR